MKIKMGLELLGPSQKPLRQCNELVPLIVIQYF